MTKPRRTRRINLILPSGFLAAPAEPLPDSFAVPLAFQREDRADYKADVSAPLRCISISKTHVVAKILPALSVTCQTRTLDSVLDGGFVYRKRNWSKLLASVRSRLFGVVIPTFAAIFVIENP